MATRIRWAVVGCGDVVRKRVAQAIQGNDYSDLVAACRRNRSELDAFCEEFHVARSSVDDETLLRDPEIDAVYIATPVCDHARQTTLAAEHGKHVMVEKPMAISTDECDRMIAAANKHDVVLGVAYYRRFYPVVERIRSLLADGRIGTPLNVSAVTANPCGADTRIDPGWRVERSKSGGGPLMDIGSHRVHLFRYLFGEIIDVKGIGTNVQTLFDVEDTAVLVMSFASRMTGTLQCHFASRSDPDEFVVHGSAGRLVVPRLNLGTLRIETADGTSDEDWPPAANFCQPLIDDFVSAVRNGHQPAITGADGRAVNDVIERAFG